VDRPLKMQRRARRKTPPSVWNVGLGTELSFLGRWTRSDFCIKRKIYESLDIETVH
jgi:hypothetical protein